MPGQPLAEEVIVIPVSPNRGPPRAGRFDPIYHEQGGITVYPKTIRLRPQDQADLEYLTLVAGMSEGAVIRSLLARAAALVRAEAIARQPTLPYEPAWVGGTGALITPADRQAWATWCAVTTASPQDQEVPYE